jgi:hypothetical protein
LRLDAGVEPEFEGGFNFEFDNELADRFGDDGRTRSERMLEEVSEPTGCAPVALDFRSGADFEDEDPRWFNGMYAD